MLESPRRVHDPVNIVPEIVMGDEGPVHSPSYDEKPKTKPERVDCLLLTRRSTSRRLEAILHEASNPTPSPLSLRLIAIIAESEGAPGPEI